MTAFAPLEIPPGTDVRGFLTELTLGAGGFGTVYRARRGERRRPGTPTRDPGWEASGSRRSRRGAAAIAWG
jgi:hypothetical protein